VGTMESQNKYLLGKLKITLIYTNLTGLHIGGNKEEVKIGGLDNPVIKIKGRYVYVPGSSLKGKVRSLLERSGYAYKGEGNKEKKEPCDCGKCDVCKLFGPHGSNKMSELRRTIFRDSNYIDAIENEITEEKMENTINRVDGSSNNLRKYERIIPGVIFKQEIIFDVYDKESDKNLLKTLFEGLKLLENDYLGGSGSRGYGKIKFLEVKIEKLKLNNNGNDKLDWFKDIKEPLDNFEIPNNTTLDIEKINKLFEKEDSVIDKVLEKLN
jgi:CRISPR-associated protein Csm3